MLVPALGSAQMPAVGSRANDASNGPLTLSGSFRIRYEALGGQFRPGLDSNDELLSLRTTLFAEYDFGRFRMGGELYDSRGYGADLGSAVSANDVNAFEPVQAYVAADLDDFLGAGNAFTLQAGRFTMNVGSRRLIANDDYRNTTNGFTGLRADLKTRTGSTATLLYVLPQTRLPEDRPSILDNEVELDRESFDLRLWGGFAQTPLIGKTKLDATFLRLEERDSPSRPTRDRRLNTAGLRLIREPAASSIDYEIEGFYQWGSISRGMAAAAPQQNVSASFLHVELGKTFAGAWKPHVSLEFDHASGDGPGDNFGRFDTLYGMRRADLGPAGIYAAIGRTNLVTPGIRLEVTPSRRTDAFVAYRALWADEKTDAFSTTGVRDLSGSAGAFAGNQVEARLRHWLVPQRVRLEANAVWLNKGDLLRSAPNAPATGDTHYGSLAFAVSF